jgi:hypothetical protein
MIALLCASAMTGVALTLAACLSRLPSPGPATIRDGRSVRARRGAKE